MALFLPDYVMKLNRMTISEFQNGNKRNIFCDKRFVYFFFDLMIHCFAELNIFV